VIIFNWKAHAVIGLLFSIPSSHGHGDILLGAFAALIPDIDHEKSLLGRFNPFVELMTHRGFTHTLTALLLFSIPFIAVGNLTFLVGYLSHLLADWLHSWGKWKIRLI
jgi:membrane-bound metal-dependent hydrolase YbcI (DUF457 family)